jgi:hypothetical protein
VHRSRQAKLTLDLLKRNPRHAGREFTLGLRDRAALLLGLGLLSASAERDHPSRKPRKAVRVDFGWLHHLAVV